MQMIVDINPLKPGMLAAYKNFCKEITGPRQKEFADLLKRYWLSTANVYHHKISPITGPPRDHRRSLRSSRSYRQCCLHL